MAKSSKQTSEERMLVLARNYDLEGQGLSTVLGELEARVMRLVWQMDRARPAKEIHGLVVREHDVALHTVITVLNNLVKKGLIGREKQGGIFHYSAAWTEEEFRAYVSRRVVEGMLSFEPSAVAACFVDVVAERDPELLDELRRLIQARTKSEESGEDG